MARSARKPERETDESAKQASTKQDKGLEELFTDTLKNIYFAKKQIFRALPKMAKSASSQELSRAFEKHREETEGHVERLEEIFETMKKPARGKTCDAIIGIIEEGKEIMEEYAGESALDAGLAASAQAVEHYEIARYGTLRTWAEELGMKDVALLLDETLQEEIKTDQLLTELATSLVKQKGGLRSRSGPGTYSLRNAAAAASYGD
jgi:ferritin-like metal-binding protein YciE